MIPKQTKMVIFSTAAMMLLSGCAYIDKEQVHRQEKIVEKTIDDFLETPYEVPVQAKVELPACLKVIPPVGASCAELKHEA